MSAVPLPDSTPGAPTSSPARRIRASAVALQRSRDHVVAFDAQARTKTPVLLIDASPGERVLFEHAFGSDVTVARSLAELELLLRRGCSWEVAFVSFQLGAGAATGLSAMVRLIQARPETALVAYTQAYENGSALFGAAARHWLGVRSIVDKSENDPRDLYRSARAVSNAAEFAPVRWSHRLQYAYLIDAVLANPSWILIWQAICESAADMQLTGELLGVSATQLRGFKDRATDAVNEFREKLSGISHPGNTRNKKGILSAFAAENRLFLTAPGLSAVMCPESAIINARCG
jgi:hypothetical protein